MTFFVCMSVQSVLNHINILALCVIDTCYLGFSMVIIYNENGVCRICRLRENKKYRSFMILGKKNRLQ